MNIAFDILVGHDVPATRIVASVNKNGSKLNVVDIIGSTTNKGCVDCTDFLYTHCDGGKKFIPGNVNITPSKSMMSVKKYDNSTLYSTYSIKIVENTPMKCACCGREYHESNGYGLCLSCEEADHNERECHRSTGKE